MNKTQDRGGEARGVTSSLRCVDTVVERGGVKGRVHLCFRVDHCQAEETLDDAQVELDECCLPRAFADLFKRDRDAEGAVKCDLIDEAVNRYLMREQRTGWRQPRRLS